MRKKAVTRKAKPTGVPPTPAVAPVVAPVVDLEALKLYRLQHGLTYRQLSDRIPMKPTTLYAVLRGRTRTKPRDTTAYRLQQFIANATDATHHNGR